MIEAREARIVYEENEYKNDIRALMALQEKVEEEIRAQEQHLQRISECEEVLQPFYEKIAEASTDGYNQLIIYISDFYYKEIYYSDAPYWGKINIRPLHYSLLCSTVYQNIPNQRHSFAQFVKDVLESHGYNVKIEKEYTDSYNGYDVLTIEW